MGRIKFKTINLGNSVRVTDPMYTRDVWCAGTVNNVLAGEYAPVVGFAYEGAYGRRNTYVQVNHVDYPDATPDTPVKFEVGVDSGMAGIFAEDYYFEQLKNLEDSWFNQIDKVVLSRKRAGLTDNNGVVCCSGYGDGIYQAMIAKNDDGKVVAIRVQFL